MHFIDYSVVIIYLLLMLGVGYTCRNSSADISDYIRMGNKSTWWLAGFSLFMQGFSAITFTGLAGSAYLAGWSIMITQWGTAAAFFIQAAWMAPIMRRTRAITPLDAVRARFGPVAEQVKVYVSLLSSFIFGGFFLLGIGTFSSALFGIPLWVMILGIGLIVVFYSVSGGSWSVQITDSLQALILLPVAVAFSMLCLHKIGGVGGLFEAIEGAGLAADYALLKPTGHVFTSNHPVRSGNFTPLWMLATTVGMFSVAISINSSHRYLSLRDEGSASKAALLAGILTLAGSFIWYIPPIYGRIFFDQQISDVTGITNPADAAYVVTAMHLLPPGVLGLIFVTMLAATMSSMDSYLTGTAGNLVRNLYQPLVRALGRKSLEGRALLRLTRGVNMGLGIWAIIMGFLLQGAGGKTGIFGILQTINALVGIPVGLPFALSLVFRRIPLWGLFTGVGCGLAGSVTLWILRGRGVILEYAQEVLIMHVLTILPTIVSSLFYDREKAGFRERVDRFFEMIRTPIDVEKEVGGTMDASLLKTVGNYVLGTAVLVLILSFFTETPEGRILIFGIAGFQFIVGGLMWLFGHKKSTTA